MIFADSIIYEMYDTFITSYFNSFMTEAVIILQSKSIGWFLYDNGPRPILDV